MSWLGIVAIVIGKYLIPVLIVPFPFAAGWANFVLDTVDGDLLIPLGNALPVHRHRLGSRTPWHIAPAAPMWMTRAPVEKRTSYTSGLPAGTTMMPSIPGPT